MRDMKDAINFHLPARGGNKLHSAAQTKTITSMFGTRVIGTVFFKIANHFMRSMARFT